LLIILFSPKAIFNSVSEEGLDLISNNFSQLHYSIKNLTLMCEPKSFKNRVEITDGIINVRNSLIFAYTNKFLSRSHNIAYRCGTDNVDVKVKKWKKKALNTKVKVKLQEIVTVTVTINEVKVDLSMIVCSR
jgi:predicted transport protein